jgi:hypothetical protein
MALCTRRLSICLFHLQKYSVQTVCDIVFYTVSVFKLRAVNVLYGRLDLLLHVTGLVFLVGFPISFTRICPVFFVLYKCTSV